MLVHRMTLVSFRLSRKNLGNLRKLFGQMVHRPPPPPPGKKLPVPPMDVIKTLKCFYYSFAYILNEMILRFKIWPRCVVLNSLQFHKHFGIEICF